MKSKAAQTISESYILGIKEGRESLEKHGVEVVSINERIENLKSAIKGFSANSSVGQMLRGELDFWRNQHQLTKTGAA